MSNRIGRLLVAAGFVGVLCSAAHADKIIENTAYGPGQDSGIAQGCASITVGIQATATADPDVLDNEWCATEFYWKYADGTNSFSGAQFYHCSPHECSNQACVSEPCDSLGWCPSDGTAPDSYVSTCNGDVCVDDEGNPINVAGGGGDQGCTTLGASLTNRFYSIPLPKVPGVPNGPNIEIWAILVAETDCKGTQAPNGLSCSTTHDSAPARIDGVLINGNEFSGGSPTSLSVVCPGQDNDNDGYCDQCDACPANADKGRVVGCCGCTASAADEVDSDGDGIADCADECPNNPLRVCEGECGCNYDGSLHCGPFNDYCGQFCGPFFPHDGGSHGGPHGDGDGDGDGSCFRGLARHTAGGPCIENPSCDTPEGPFCPEEDPFKTDIECAEHGELALSVGSFCSALFNCYDRDSDGDCTIDCHDHCPFDINKVQPGICGCNWPDVDTDGDGTYDCPCFELPASCNDDSDCGPGTCEPCTPGFGTTCFDQGAGNHCVVEGVCGDSCPQDPNKLSPGICGCSVSDVDSDGDGVADCLDNCPADANKTEPGLCGCGIADTGDSDGDGTLDCLDLCPDDPAKTSPGICGCFEPEAPAGGYTIGGFVHVPSEFFNGIPYVEVQLTCENSSPNQFISTCDVDSISPTGKFEFHGVPCGICSLSFRYTDTCEDAFDVKYCGNEASVGAGQWVTFNVNQANSGGMAPCLQSIDVVAKNNTYDLLMLNQQCAEMPQMPCFDNNGAGPGPLSETLPRLAACFFTGRCCGTRDTPIASLGPVTACKCRYDCNNDEIFSIVSDLWCWQNCIVGGVCHPDNCDDAPDPRLPLSGFVGQVVGGIIFGDVDQPLTSGVEGVQVDVVAADGTVYTSETNRIGVWAVDGLEDGVYTVEFDGGKSTSSIVVNDSQVEKNQSIKWHRKSNARRLIDRGRASAN